MKYILDYLREEMFIEPVAGCTIDAIDEEVESNIPIGHRLVLNGKETDIVVWFVDYDKWLESKYEKLQDEYHKLMRMLPTPEYDDNKQWSDDTKMD